MLSEKVEWRSMQVRVDSMKEFLDFCKDRDGKVEWGSMQVRDVSMKEFLDFCIDRDA